MTTPDDSPEDRRPAAPRRSGAPRRSPRSRGPRPEAGSLSDYSPASSATPARRPSVSRVTRLADTSGPDRAAALPDVRLAAGVFTAVHGLRGELRLQLWSDAPEHLASVRRVWVGEEANPRQVLGFRITGDRALVRLAGVTTPEAARTFVGQTMYIAGEDAAPLEEGEYFLFQLVGLNVVTDDGEPLGEIVDIIETGANDVLVIKPADGADVLYPHHGEFVVGVDLDAGTMTVRRLDYLN